MLIKGNGQSTQELIQELLTYPQVKAAEPNYIVTLGSSQPPEDMTAEDAAEIFDDSSAGGEEEPFYLRKSRRSMSLLMTRRVLLQTGKKCLAARAGNPHFLTERQPIGQRPMTMTALTRI